MSEFTWCNVEKNITIRDEIKTQNDYEMWELYCKMYAIGVIYEMYFEDFKYIYKINRGFFVNGKFCEK